MFWPPQAKNNVSFFTSVVATAWRTMPWLFRPISVTHGLPAAILGEQPLVLPERAGDGRPVLISMEIDYVAVLLEAAPEVFLLRPHRAGDHDDASGSIRLISS